MTDRAVPDMSVVVPVYRNATTVDALADQILSVAGELGLSAEIVFVNDASPDDSLDRLTALARTHPSVVVVDLPRNVGQHAAVLHGLAHARGRTCAVMDADLQDRPASLATLWRARSPHAGAVFGSRVGRYEQAGRHLTSRLFKRVLHVLTGVPKDAGLFVLLERDAVDALVRFPTRTPWIQAMIGLLRIATISVPVERDHRRDGTSSYDARKRVKTAVRGIWCVIEYRCWRAPTPYLTAQRGQLPPNRAAKSA